MEYFRFVRKGGGYLGKRYLDNSDIWFEFLLVLINCLIG